MSFARMRAIIVVGALVTCAAIFVVFALLKDHQTGGPTTRACPKDAVIADLRLPAEKDVKINLIDASGGRVSIGGIGAELQNRGFQVNIVAPEQPPVEDVAVLGYGPKGVGSAWVIQAYFHGDARNDFQLKRTDNAIDVTIGTGFRKLATISEVKGQWGQRGRPSEPPGTCANDPA